MLRYRVMASLLFLASVAVGADEPTSRPAVKRQTVTFAEPSPVSDLREWVYREGGTVQQLRQAGAEYDLAKESFELVVPDGVAREDPYGLFVWISPGRAGWPKEWFDVAARHRLIWVSPNNAGNSRNALVRIALAMDAVHNLKKQYPIDGTRIYVAGFSGGGRAASIAAVGFPDVFTGGIAMMGSNFYRPLPTGKPREFYPQGSFRPPGRLFDAAKTHPLVLMTSERDMNREQTKVNLDAFVHDGFKHVTMLEVPGIGHEMPGAEWLEKGIVELEKVKGVKPATGPATRPGVKKATGR